MGDEATGTADGTAEAPQGIDRVGVEAWFAEHIPGVEAPLTFERIAGGHSNLTYGVRDAAGTRWALRRPPLGKRLATAHDMGREHRIVSALRAHRRPGRRRGRPLRGRGVNGAPFYVMEFVEGSSSADRRGGALPRRASAATASPSSTSSPTIHAVDPDAVGLGELGRKEDYIARQLKRWNAQWQTSKTRELPAIDEVHDRLRRAPRAGPGDDRPRRLPPRQLHGHAARARWPRSSTGSSAPSATRSPTSAC